MNNNTSEPQAWWRPWQWILALVIAPAISSWGTVTIDHILTRRRQISTWRNTTDEECYLKNVFNALKVTTSNGFIVHSRTCESGNTFVRVESPHRQESGIHWLNLEELISNYNLAKNHRILNQAFAQKIPKETQHLIKQNTTICFLRKGDIIIYIIRRPDGICVKEKVNTMTGRVIESIEVSCNNASCD